MSTLLRLHYAPDNASLCVRLALAALDAPHELVLVNRRAQGQMDPAYLKMNPMGLIPVLETPQGALFETGAILLWLADRHSGRLFPAADDAARGPALTWHTWLGNTLHVALRMLFYPEHYTDQDTDTFRCFTRTRCAVLLNRLDAASPTFLDANVPHISGCYLGPMLRWLGVYGGSTDWFDLSDYPHLAAFAARFEALEFAAKIAEKEGLGRHWITQAGPANPPEGSPT